MHLSQSQCFVPETKKEHLLFMDLGGSQKTSFQNLSSPYLTLCLSQPSMPVQSSHDLLLLMGCLHAHLIQLHHLYDWAGWHLLLHVLPEHMMWACVYSLSISQGPVIGQKHNMDNMLFYTSTYLTSAVQFVQKYILEGKATLNTRAPRHKYNRTKRCCEGKWCRCRGQQNILL